MARASARLIVALRETALSLEREATIYRWSRFAHCNCGHLAQTITGLAPSTIETAAKIDFPHGERKNVIAYLRAWAELLEEKLPASELPTREPAVGVRMDYLLAAE